MSNKILMVDEDNLFVQDLKRALKHLSNVFETDICFFFYKAIKRLKTTEYNFLITGIRTNLKWIHDILIDSFEKETHVALNSIDQLSVIHFLNLDKNR